ncbi:ABC1 kinase family protein [Tropicimonas sediminicola]|uniref:Predicted unusual protein kinase regulating ubiquinone biosynthesis, AarF/ABC1/UbiB family n=1 Tax=Tropicimonas sediminicola TaxID=1031541 RepID=A0A239CYK4_9RHOB|nr:AarF/ABC1/UbiB kinase family protein [Tropicimonas sediminicola]SNS24952.1 Predicted unusual protein kinase regulating ubiquinone biosynthesis, AarF/ABC1/UbiB family [Tropicimonas sediminicola]
MQSRRPFLPNPVPAGRAARLHRLGMMATGIAGNMAAAGARSVTRGERPDLRQLLLTPANATRIADDLARMRGAAMKVGQLLSMEAGDVLSPELATILSRLRAAADPMPPQQLKTVLRDAWGSDWRRSFRQFDTRPIAAASIGQVHRAKLRDGTQLAIKVQYPGVARSIDSDIDNLGTLIRVSGLLPAGFEIAPYLAEAKRQLHLEADYRFEAEQLTAYARLLGETTRFEIPTVAKQWSTGSVLAMSYHPSRSIDWLAEASQGDRDRVARDLIALLLDEIFRFGVIQSDPNFANYRYNPESGRVVLLDFGATRRLAPEIVDRCREILVAVLAGDTDGIETAFVALGALPDEMPRQHRARILAMIRMVFDELRRDELDFGDSDLLTRLRAEGQALAEDRVSPPEVPMDLLYLQRKIGGIFLLATRLRARVAVGPLLDPFAKARDAGPE